MKLTVFTNNKNEWHIQQLKKSCKKFGVSFQQFEKIANPNHVDLTDVWDVIFLRKFWLKPDQTSFILESLKDKILINRTLLDQPHTQYKYYQQKYISLNTDVHTIPTYVVKTESELKMLIKKWDLHYPIIQKPNYWAKWKWIMIIKSAKDISWENIGEYIFQSFIENDWDFRVLVCWWKVIGIVKRIAKEWHFLNNISQWWHTESVDDVSIIKETSDIGLKVAMAFNLTLAWVDVIRDKRTWKYYFMEVNTLTQWDIVQKTSKENITDIIIQTAIHLYRRNQEKTYDLVKDYYDHNIDFLWNYRSHYLIRIFLWTNEKQYIKRIKWIEQEYIWKNDQETTNIIKKLNTVNWENVWLLKHLRLPFLKKYPTLKSANSLLFHNLFANVIYKKNLKKFIQPYFSDKDFLNLKDALYKDKNAIAMLSTHAINLFYNLWFYLQQDLVDPEYIYQIGQKYYDNKNHDHLKLKIYLYTHCIIGASNFYSKKITKHLDVFKKMLKNLEDVIHDNYFNIMMDNKLEFLVCCTIIWYITNLDKIILWEAENSLSDVGNYIVDTLNSSNQSKKDFSRSEHRNVLYLMANLPYIPKNIIL